jgi:acetylornithine deacetylase/succinyl-diaminopimelate desuccinylase-like protein
MSRDTAIQASTALIDNGAFLEELSRRVGFRTESQNPASAGELDRYLVEEMQPTLHAIGFTTEIVPNTVPARGPFLIAQRIEDPALPTVLIYGHGDVVHGQDAAWREGLSPWTITQEGERWYGRGTADNKGQHGVNLAALTQVLNERGGKLGFNAKILLEMGEEAGSPGLAAICQERAADLKADVLIASDGPRLSADRATIFLGSRGAFNVGLEYRARERAYHSGNWGGVIRNPGTVMANAIASMVDGQGRLKVDGLLPPPMPNSVRTAIAGLTVGGGETDLAIDADWGAEGLTPAERLFGWNTLEVLAMGAGDPEAPMNAVPSIAKATVQLRHVAGTDEKAIVPAIRAHLDAHGFGMVRIVESDREPAPATRLDPDSPWVRWAVASVTQTLGAPPVILPNIGGSLPNHVFAHTLGLPTLWVPHSYAACSQHAPDEHVLVPVMREGLAIMAGLFWDLGENAPHRG